MSEYLSLPHRWGLPLVLSPTMWYARKFETRSTDFINFELGLTDKRPTSSFLSEPHVHNGVTLI